MSKVAAQMRPQRIFFFIIIKSAINDPIFTKGEQHKAHVIIMAMIVAVVSAFCQQVQIIFAFPTASQYSPAGLRKDQIRFLRWNSLTPLVKANM